MTTDLLTADQVSDRLGIDRSTVYRMAMDGRLEAVKVGRQWRFPASPLDALAGPAIAGTDADAARAAGPLVPQRMASQAVLEAIAPTLGVMLLLTDMDGVPISEVVNPCPWFDERGLDADVMDSCRVQWRSMADDPVLTPQLELGAHGFECARSFVRTGDRLVAMVLAGGVAPAPLGRDAAVDAGLHHLDTDQRARLVAALPRIAAALSTLSTADPSHARSTS